MDILTGAPMWPRPPRFASGSAQPSHCRPYTETSMECGLCSWKFDQCMEHNKQVEAPSVHSVCCPPCYGLAKVKPVWDYIGPDPDTQESKNGTIVDSVLPPQDIPGSGGADRDSVEVINCSPDARSRLSLNPDACARPISSNSAIRRAPSCKTAELGDNCPPAKKRSFSRHPGHSG